MQDLFFLFFDGLAQFIKKSIYVFKFAVNRSKPHIGDLVDAFQLRHRQLADLQRGDLAVERVEQAMEVVRSLT